MIACTYVTVVGGPAFGERVMDELAANVGISDSATKADTKRTRLARTIMRIRTRY
jgi:hypothetical protein